MKTKFVLLMIVAVFSSSAMAYEAADSTAFTLRESFGGVAASTQGTSDASNQLMKIVVPAQEDAAYFLATDGEIRSTRFIHALNVLRSMNPESTASDTELALTIINFSQP